MAFHAKEVPSRTVDSVNKVFVLDNTINTIDDVFVDGAVYLGTITVSGAQITLADAPTVDIYVDYYDSTPTVATVSGTPGSSTLSDILKRVRAHLGENYSEEWKDTELKYWINQAVKRIANEADWWWAQVSPETVNAISGTTSYSLDNNLKKISQVLDVTDSDHKQELDFVRYDRYNLNDTANNLKGTYSLEKSSLIIKVDSNTTIEVKYYRYPPNLVEDDDQTIVPIEFDDAIVYWAVARGREQEEELKQAEYFDARYREVMDKAIISNNQLVSKAFPSFSPIADMY